MYRKQLPGMFREVGARYNDECREMARPVFSTGIKRSGLPISLPSHGNKMRTDNMPRQPRCFEDERPMFSREQMQQGRKNYKDNVERASQASLCQRQRQRDVELRDAQKRDDHERMRLNACERLQVDDHRDTARQEPKVRKRRTPSAPEDSATHNLFEKRRRSELTNDILVWQQGSSKPSLIDRALREGESKVNKPNDRDISSCLRDGLTIVSGGGGSFYTDGLSSDDSMRASWWYNLVKNIQVQEYGHVARVADCGGTDCRKIGVGTFNMVVSFADGFLPPRIPTTSVFRFTRPDRNVNTPEYKYQTFQTVFEEIYNALFASANNIGAEVYSVSAFSAPRYGRTLRFCTAMCMERATMDLNKALRKMTTFAEGAKAAELCIDLLYNVSRLGVAFFDIKPGNILRFESADGSVYYKLTDYDPAFFIRTEGRDWRALMLLNLALLSTHVYNGELGAVGRGWAKTVAPVLRQLVERRKMYDSEWLFLARCTSLKFEVPIDTSDFSLQRHLVCMCESYFYGSGRSEALSYKWWWRNKSNNDKDLIRFWEKERNKRSWPPGWGAPDSAPLIQQLVDVSLRHA